MEEESLGKSIWSKVQKNMLANMRMEDCGCRKEIEVYCM